MECAVPEAIELDLDPALLWSFAYRKGLGWNAVHALAIAREASNRWVVRADIEDYFERILR